MRDRSGWRNVDPPAAGDGARPERESPDSMKQRLGRLPPHHRRRPATGPLRTRLPAGLARSSPRRGGRAAQDGRGWPFAGRDRDAARRPWGKQRGAEQSGQHSDAGGGRAGSRGDGDGEGWQRGARGAGDGWQRGARGTGGRAGGREDSDRERGGDRGDGERWRRGARGDGWRRGDRGDAVAARIVTVGTIPAVTLVRPGVMRSVRAGIASMARNPTATPGPGRTGHRTGAAAKALRHRRGAGARRTTASEETTRNGGRPKRVAATNAANAANAARAISVARATAHLRAAQAALKPPYRPWFASGGDGPPWFAAGPEPVMCASRDPDRP